MFIIIIIIIIIIVELIAPVFYWVQLIMSQPLPAVQRHNTLRKRWAVPSMADNCTLPINSGTPSLSYQVLALFNILPRAPITIGITVTFEAP